MFNYVTFDVDITRELDARNLRWPERGEAMSESCLGGNRSYADFRGLSWTDAQRLFELETALIEKIETAVDPETEHDEIEDELCETDEGLNGLDMGVASATAALCAAGCVTCTSCNGGAFGGHHHESYPLVAFFVKAYHIAPLVSCAERAAVGLESVDGLVIAFANDIRAMRSFAAALISDRSVFRAARPKRSGAKTRKESIPDCSALPLFEAAARKR
jgi:hypothetical protein